jgi:signal-transduction protein with cAMP-binding, CBS, and nucleotidyltransferase domain
MKVTEVMHSPAVMCRTTATLHDVARLMSDRNVGSVVVIDNIGYLAGIVTDRDLALRGLGQGRSAESKVENVMSRDVATVTLHTDVSDAAQIMAKRLVRRLPVVDEQQHIYGVVTLDDLLRHLGSDADRLADTVLMQSRHFPVP